MVHYIRCGVLVASLMVQSLLAIFDAPYANRVAVCFSQHQSCDAQSVLSYASAQAWGAPAYNPLAATVQSNEWSCAANQQVHTAERAESNDHQFFKTIRALQLQGDYRALQKMKRMLIRRQKSWRDAFAFRWAAYEERKRQLRQLKKLMGDPTTHLLCKLKEADIATALQLVQSLKQELATHKAIGTNQTHHDLSVEEKIRAAMQIIRARSDYESYLKAEEIHRRLEHEKRRCTHARVVEALTQETECGLLADRLGVLSQEVFLCAQHHNYEVHPDVQEHVGISIHTIRTTQQAHEVVFHVSYVERVLTDIQMQTQPHTTPQPTLLERSPELLMRALEKFVTGLNPVTQVKKAVEFWIGTAHFIADVTVGTFYLTAEQYNQRVQGFWNTLEAMSPSNLSQLTAEQWVDIAAQMAADMVYARGVASTIAYLKEVDAVAKAQRKVSCIADKFKRGLDHIIGKDPIVVTPDGLVMRMSEDLSELNNVARSSIKNSEELLIKGGSVFSKVEQRVNEILNHVKHALDNLTVNGNQIKSIDKNAFKVQHMFFTRERAKSGMMLLGKTEEEISMKIIELVKVADSKNLLAEGTKSIMSYLNGSPVEIRVNIYNGCLRSVNTFPGHSPRNILNSIRIPSV